MPFSPVRFLDTWWRSAGGSLAGYQQQDAHEFYLSLLDGLSQPPDRSTTPSASGSPSPAPHSKSVTPTSEGGGLLGHGAVVEMHWRSLHASHAALCLSVWSYGPILYTPLGGSCVGPPVSLPVLSPPGVTQLCSPPTLPVSPCHTFCLRYPGCQPPVNPPVSLVLPPYASPSVYAPCVQPLCTPLLCLPPAWLPCMSSLLNTSLGPSLCPCEAPTVTPPV